MAVHSFEWFIFDRIIEELSLWFHEHYAISRHTLEFVCKGPHGMEVKLTTQLTDATAQVVTVSVEWDDGDGYAVGDNDYVEEEGWLEQTVGEVIEFLQPHLEANTDSTEAV